MRQRPAASQATPVRPSSGGRQRGALYVTAFLAVAGAGAAGALIGATKVRQPEEGVLYVLGVALALYVAAFLTSVFMAGFVVALMKVFFAALSRASAEPSRMQSRRHLLRRRIAAARTLPAVGLIAAAVLFAVGLSIASAAVFVASVLSGLLAFFASFHLAAQEIGRGAPGLSDSPHDTPC